MSRRMWMWSATGLVGAMMLLHPGQAFASAEGCQYSSCTSVTNVKHTFAAGSSWSFDIMKCACEGLVVGNAYYKPSGGVSRQILHRGSIAQVHVPYLTGSPRFLDLTHDTSGLGANALTLTREECPGVLYGSNEICKSVESRGYAWKHKDSYRLGESVAVFMASQLGRYTYINRWEFHEDGTIEPKLGLTGQLPLYGQGAAYAPYGARVNPEWEATPIYGISRFHNAYYRLDFDINGASNDAVARMGFQPSAMPSTDTACAVAGQCGTLTETLLTTELGVDLNPTEYTTLRVYDKSTRNADGRTIGYELVPHIQGLWSGMTSTGEPWSAQELWVTQYKSCELLATDNHPPHIPANCVSRADNVQEMVDGQSIDGRDVVVWYANRILHAVRDEDESFMPVDWARFELRPRNFHHVNPLQGSGAGLTQEFLPDAPVPFAPKH